jgi:hypothetical protein
MPKAGFSVARFSFLVLAAGMLGMAMLAAPAAGQTSSCAPPSGKCFAVTGPSGEGPVTPSSPAAGTSTPFAFEITNEATTQQLGSVQISAPAGFVITSAPGAASVTSSSALFLNLPLSTQGSMTTLTVNATVSCNRSTSDYQWGIEAKQSNNFNGTGNDVLLDPSSAGNLSGKLTGCAFQPCPPNKQCSASASSATTSGIVVTTSPLPAGDSIVTGMASGSGGSPFDFSCGTTPPVYTPLSDVFDFAVFNASGMPQQGVTLSVTLRIDKSVVTSSGHPGASSWQICYASTESFKALDGTSQQNVTIGGNPGYFTGLLRDCSSTQPAPCVQARNKNNAGDVIVTFLSLGDPFAHG